MNYFHYLRIGISEWIVYDLMSYNFSVNSSVSCSSKVTLSIFNPKIPFENAIHYEKLNSLWTWYMLEMYYFHGLKTMTFNCQGADIIFLSCSYGDNPVF